MCDDEVDGKRRNKRLYETKKITAFASCKNSFTPFSLARCFSTFGYPKIASTTHATQHSPFTVLTHTHTHTQIQMQTQNIYVIYARNLYENWRKKFVSLYFFGFSVIDFQYYWMEYSLYYWVATLSLGM